MTKITLVLLLLFTSLLASNAKSVRYMESVKDVVIATQKTRGGTYNFLNGNEFAQFGVYEQRSQLKNDFKSLNRQYKVVGPQIDSEFDKLYRQMKSLNKLSFELDPLTSFKAYSTLIKKMIQLSEKVQKKLYANSSKLDQKVSLVMSSDILRLTEGLGKLRGLGSGIAARKECEDEEVDYMLAYIEEIDVNMNKFINSMVTLNKNYGSKYPNGLNKKLSKYKKDVNYYIAFAKDKLIDKDDIKINSNEYFSRGTDLISGALEFYDMNAEILKD